MISVKKRNAYIRADGEFHNRIHEVVLGTEHDRAMAAKDAEIKALRAGKEFCGACGEGCESCRVLQESPDLAELAQARCEQQAKPAPAQDEREAPVVVATAILGGIYHGGSGPELGEIDIEVCMPALEALQCEMVNSSDDVLLPLMPVVQHERIVAALTRPAQTAPQPCAEVAAVGHWERSLVATWPADEDDAQGAWVIGTTDEDGNRYEVITIEADQYDAPGDSEKIARAMIALWSQAFAAPIAQTGQQPVLSNCLDLVEKMTVSVDVSTGDDDAFNRLFCKVAGVQEESDGSWTILAVDPEPNFAAPIAQTEQQPKHSGLVTEAMRNAAIAEYSRHDGDFSDFADSVIRAALSAGGRDE